MPDYKHSEHIKYNVIYSDLSSKIYDSLQQIDESHNISIIARIHIFGTSWISPSGYDNYNWRAEIELLNSDGTLSDGIAHNDWRMQVAYTCTQPGGNNRSNQFFKVRFIDAFGMENIDGIYPISDKGLVLAYRRFVILSEYKGYKVAVLETEKKELQAENYILKEDIVALKKEIAKLKEHLSHLG